MRKPASHSLLAQRAELVELMMRMGQVAHRRSSLDTLTVMNEFGLTMGQMVALFILANAGPKPMGVLGQRVHLSPAATTHMIDQLVAAGLVERAEQHEDRRQKHVQITAKGRALIRRLDVERRHEMGQVIANLRPETVARLAQALQLVVEDLTQDLMHDLSAGHPPAKPEPRLGGKAKA